MHRSSTCRPPHRKGPRANTHDPRIRSGMLHSLAPAQYLRTYTRTSVHDTGQPQNIVRTHSRSRPQTAGRRARTAEKYTLRSGEITSVHACLHACIHSRSGGGQDVREHTHSQSGSPPPRRGSPTSPLSEPRPSQAKLSPARPRPRVLPFVRSFVCSFVRSGRLWTRREADMRREEGSVRVGGRDGARRSRKRVRERGVIEAG